MRAQGAEARRTGGVFRNQGDQEGGIMPRDTDNVVEETEAGGEVLLQDRNAEDGGHEGGDGVCIFCCGRSLVMAHVLETKVRGCLQRLWNAICCQRVLPGGGSCLVALGERVCL